MEIVKLDSQKAIKALRLGMVLVCPTDTVYGLICDAANKKAVEKIYKIKKRPKNKLLPIFVKDIKMAKEFVEINPKQEKFLKKVWPGAVTVVIEKNKSAFRMPNHKFVLNLVKHAGPLAETSLVIDMIGRLGRPLAETSANISGQPATTKIKEVLKYFKGRKYGPDLIIDAGDLKPAKPSQVVDFTGSKPKVLRK